MQTQFSPEHAPVEGLNALGISWAQIFAWVATYGLPLLLKVLPLIVGGQATKLSVAQIVSWVQQALASANAGQPLPPLPTPNS